MAYHDGLGKSHKMLKYDRSQENIDERLFYMIKNVEYRLPEHVVQRKMIEDCPHKQNGEKELNGEPQKS